MLWVLIWSASVRHFKWVPTTYFLWINKKIQYILVEKAPYLELCFRFNIKTVLLIRTLLGSTKGKIYCIVKDVSTLSRQVKKKWETNHDKTQQYIYSIWRTNKELQQEHPLETVFSNNCSKILLLWPPKTKTVPLLTILLLPCLSKQCRSRSVVF